MAETGVVSVELLSSYFSMPSRKNSGHMSQSRIFSIL